MRKKTLKQVRSIGWFFLSLIFFLFINCNLLPISFSSSISEKEPTTFIRTYGDGGIGPSSGGFSVRQTKDGGYLVCGYKTGVGGNRNLYLLKVNNKGDSIWEKNYGDSVTDEVGYSIHQTLDGGFIVVGTQADNNYYNSNVYILRINYNGDIVWSKTYGEPDCKEEGYSIVETEDGGFIITGDVSYTDSSAKVLLVKIDEDGKLVWSKSIGDKNQRLYGREIIRASDGKLVITGKIETLDSGSNVLLVKIDKNGDVEWIKSIGSTTYNEGGNSLAEHYDGRFVITGQQVLSDTNSCGTSCGFVIETDKNGDLLSMFTFGRTEEMYFSCGNSIKKTSDGEFIITGTYAFTPVYRSGNVYLVKLNSNCSKLWTKTFGIIVGWDSGISIDVTDDNGFIITGVGYNTRGCNVILIKTDKNGNVDM